MTSFPPPASPDFPGQPPTPDRNFWDHLQELRWRVLKGLVAVAVGFGVAYYFSNEILAFLVLPLIKVLPPGQRLIFTGLPEGFLIHLKIALGGGIFLAAPFWLYQFWSFVAPGLYQRERRWVVGLAGGASILLFLGACFGYFVVFPVAFSFFLSFGGDLMMPLPAAGSYFSLTLSLLLAFGLIFQLPLVLLFLGELGVISASTLSQKRKYAVLAIFVVSAILTPPEVMSQIIMAVSLIVLYELSLGLMRCREKRRKRSQKNAPDSATAQDRDPPNSKPGKSRDHPENPEETL